MMMNKKDLKAGLYDNDYFEKMVNTLLELFKHSEENVKIPIIDGLDLDISVVKGDMARMSRYSDSLTEQFRSIPRTIDHGVNPEHKKRLDHLSNLHAVKNAKYGKSFDRGLDKHGVISWIVRDEDKENRMLELFDQCIKKDEESGKWYFDGSSLDGNDESLSDTLLDRANYLIMLDMWINQLPKKSTFNKDAVDYEAHARKKFLTNSIYNKALLESREEVKVTPKAIAIRKPISQEVWDSKLYLGWPKYLLEKMFYVSESAQQCEEEQGEVKMNEIEYPFFIEGEEMVSDKRFHNELCHHTGRVMVSGPLKEDVWNEYIDSDGDFHYGR